MKWIDNLFGDYSENEIKRINKIVDDILALENKISKLTDKELKNQTNKFKDRLASGESLDSILVEAFAVVREAAYRTLGMKHYRVQIIGGIILHQGRIAEMKTGEGKTLVGTLPAYLNALEGKGVHIITSNEYLAQRDCEEMGQVHRFLGLTVAVVLHEMEELERRSAYNCDITYGVNSELGFDYLKDNMVTNKEEKVQRGLNFAIIDEIDSILIDEARTPLIISGDGEEGSDYYIKIDEFIKSLKKEVDYEIDEKKKAVTLTNQGIKKVEVYFKIDNYGDLENVKLQHHITQSLKANYIMKKDIDYIENEDGEILIVDGFTGRVMEGRRFSDGLHQAIEAKEDVDIEPESKTLATITLQNLFKMYNKLSGMSGTVFSEEKEFREVYGIDVIKIPTNKPVQRVDNNDVVYSTIIGKYKGIADEIEKCYKNLQPVLVGTSSIQKSEDISAILKRRKIPHNVLNAKNHKLEADIIKRAGEPGAVTIATNMAGRGTDIKLPKESFKRGGLKVIGTERHDSVRVDNQLRGRSGRQGDVGESLFFVSLEDDMIKNNISNKFKVKLDKLNIDKNKPIEYKHINKVVEMAQKYVEGDNFAARKDVVGYDDVLDKQRHVIYEQRNIILEKDSIEDEIIKMIDFVITKVINEYSINNDINKFEEDIRNIFKSKVDIKYDENIIKFRKEIIEDYLKVKEVIGEEKFNEINRESLLETVDEIWIEYLSEVDYLKLGIGLRSMKQQDPVQAFQIEASEMFIRSTEMIKVEGVKRILSKVKEAIEIKNNL